MTSKKKKVFILIGMVALLVLTGVLNIVLNTAFGAESASGDDIVYGDFFVTFKQDRESSRDQSMLYYDGIISSADSSAEAKANAEAAKLALAQAMDTETILEGLIKSLGFDDAIVTNTTNNLNVIVRCEEMTSTQATQILKIITTETDIKATNVRIIPTE